MSDSTTLNSQKIGSISSLLQKIDIHDNTLQTLPLNVIEAGPHQPRQSFSEEALKELAASIKQYGVMQPIIVVEGKDSTYSIVAGERRYRAAKLAGLESIPALVKQITDKENAALSLIENLQRADLTSYEQAQALARLKELFKLRNKELAQMISKSEKHISVLLSLTKLPVPLEDLMHRGTDSPETLAVLSRAFNINPELTNAFVSSKDDIKYREANEFYDFIKKSSKPEKEEQTSNDENLKESLADEDHSNVSMPIDTNSDDAHQLITTYNDVEKVLFYKIALNGFINMDADDYIILGRFINRVSNCIH